MDSDCKTSKLKKMTRSLSFKFSSQITPKRQDSRKVMKKLDADNWIKGKPPSGGSRQETPPSNIRLFNSVGDKTSLWANKAEDHARKQAVNPFSDKFDKALCRLRKNDPTYGRPEENSLSQMRARAGEARMRAEICDVCEAVFHHGQRSEDGTAAIQFGSLFHMYNRINDKVVGLLIRARKKELLDFQGEMLYQRRDDEEWIVLTKNINTIRAYFGREPDLPCGGPLDHQVAASLVFGEEESRKGSLTSVTSLPAKLNPVGSGGIDFAVCTATIEAESTCAGLLGSTAIQLAGLPVILHADPLPSSSPRQDEVKKNEEEDKKKNSLDQEKEKKAGLGVKSATKSLRESFRNMVKPKVQKRRECEEVSEDEEEPEPISLLRRLSRRGSSLSRRSARLATDPNTTTTARLEDTSRSRQPSEQPPNPSSRWRRILGVSLAITRMANLTKANSPEIRVHRSGSFEAAGGQPGSFPAAAGRQTGSFPAEAGRQTGSFPAAAGRQTGSFPAAAGSQTGSFPAAGSQTGSFPVAGSQTGSFPAAGSQTGSFNAVTRTESLRASGTELSRIKSVK